MYQYWPKFCCDETTPSPTTRTYRRRHPSSLWWGQPSDKAVVMAFLPDFTEHPKPRRRLTKAAFHESGDGNRNNTPIDDEEDEETAFFHDFVAGGVAGCASVVVGHPFDTLKVRLQTSQNDGGIRQILKEFGGVSSLFRGMGPPLGAAAAINAIVFGSYGFSSRLYDTYIPVAEEEVEATHDPWQKSLTCGSFAGAVQCSIICPIEHIKCRLQTHTAGSPFASPVQAVRHITSQYGVLRLYQGFWSTALREIPAFGLYFASYDYLKDKAMNYLGPEHGHQWLASAFAGGCAGSITWVMVYPVDVIKTRIQTAPLHTPFVPDLRMWNVGKGLVEQYGVRYLFRGLGITLLRAFPVNGTIFPVYELALRQLTSLGY